MKMEQNELGQIKINCPQLYYKGNWYIDWPTFVELAETPSTSLFRVLKNINNYDQYVLKIKNRKYYNVIFCMPFLVKHIKLS